MQIKVKYTRDVAPIERIKVGDWIDLCAAETVYIDGGEFAMIH